jgi:hypothetical protein
MEQMTHFKGLETIRLRKGAGKGDPKDGLCLMQAVHWFSGADKLSDRPECASPALCTLGIRLNDTAPDQAARDGLWPLVWLLLDSRDGDAEQIRAKHIVREITHRIVSPLFLKRYPDHAAALLAANSMAEIKTAADAAARTAYAAYAAVAHAAAGRRAAAGRQAAAAGQVYAAADAVDAVDAAAAAAAAADAAAAARQVYAAADAVDAVAAAADAAAAARRAYAAAYATRTNIWMELRQIFVEAIALGKHGEIDPIYEPRAAELVRVMALAR